MSNPEIAPVSQAGPINTDPWVILNIALAGMLILLATDPAVVFLIGGSALCVAAATGAGAAWRRLAATSTADIFTLVLAWFPGFAALVLAVLGLVLVVRSPENDLLRLGGLALFLMQIAFIALLDTRRQAATAPADRSA
jgi:hypothetical protein